MEQINRQIIEFVPGLSGPLACSIVAVFSWGESALFLACTVGLATIVAGWAAPSGIVLGFALGPTWSTALELPVKLA